MYVTFILLSLFEMGPENLINRACLGEGNGNSDETVACRTPGLVTNV